MRVKWIVRRDSGVVFGVRWDERNRELVVGGPNIFAEMMLEVIDVLCECGEKGGEVERSFDGHRIRFTVRGVGVGVAGGVEEMRRRVCTCGDEITEVTNMGRLMT